MIYLTYPTIQNNIILIHLSKSSNQQQYISDEDHFFMIYVTILNQDDLMFLLFLFC